MGPSRLLRSQTTVHLGWFPQLVLSQSGLLADSTAPEVTRFEDLKRICSAKLRGALPWLHLVGPSIIVQCQSLQLDCSGWTTCSTSVCLTQEC